MAVPTGTASLLDIQNEFGGSNPIGLNEYYGAAAGVPTSGTISINNLRGKANVFTFSVTGSVQYANLNTLATNAGWDGSKPVICTINSGVWLYSNSTGTAGLTIGSFPGGLTLVNYGYIIGKGGNGAYTGNGGGGGVGLYNTSTGVTIQNYNYIAGGGGGGAGAWNGGFKAGGGGGGAGGGTGGGGYAPPYRAGGAGATSPGGGGSTGAGPSPGYGGGSGGGGAVGNAFYGSGGGGGGKILPGSGGSGQGGRNGGSGGAAGVNGTWPTPAYAGGGGGWGAVGGYGCDTPNTNWAYRSGGAGGKAINSTQAYTLSNSATIYGGT